MRHAGQLLPAPLVAVTLVLLGSLGAAPAVAAPARTTLTIVEANLMCPSCHEPLELAQSPQAQAEKARAADLVNRGWSLRQIENWMVGQYGLAVLGKPPASGFNLTVYILPPAVLVIGIAILVYTLPKWRDRGRRAAVTKLPEADPLDAVDAQRLDDDLARFI
jgi:cytochrome c-type biogenesis protein CcmH/NrfF